MEIVREYEQTQAKIVLMCGLISDLNLEDFLQTSHLTLALAPFIGKDSFREVQVTLKDLIQLAEAMLVIKKIMNELGERLADEKGKTDGSKVQAPARSPGPNEN